MAKFFRNKQELIFWVTAIALFVLLVIYAAYTVTFLVRKTTEINNPNLLKTQEVVKFNLAKVKELKKER